MSPALYGKGLLEVAQTGHLHIYQDHGLVLVSQQPVGHFTVIDRIIGSFLDARATAMKEFEAWWRSSGQGQAVQMGLDLTNAKKVAWDAWRAGREQLHVATAYQRLQPCRS